MKKVLFLFFLVAVLCGAAPAQTQTRVRRSSSNDALEHNESLGVRSRTVAGIRKANYPEKITVVSSSLDEMPADPARAVPVYEASGNETSRDLKTWGNATVLSSAWSSQPAPPGNENGMPPNKGLSGTMQTSPQLVRGTAAASTAAPQPPITPAFSPSTLVRDRAIGSSPVAGTALPPTEEYLVGVSDVLDIRLVDMPTRQSTLFTVLAGGVIGHPLLNAPVKVAGLTINQIAARLTAEIRVIHNARVSVGVRDYASHGVVVTGLVDNPGRKALRREAMPLYAILAEALPRPEASVATIVRAGRADQSLQMGDQKAMATLVVSGDLVRVSANAAPKQFFYVGGEVVSPGEKNFRPGMTLTQAILTCGGVRSGAVTAVKISRRNGNGFLVAAEHDLRAINEGRAPDPLLQAGDRIEVGHAVW